MSNKTHADVVDAIHKARGELSDRYMEAIHWFDNNVPLHTKVRFDGSTCEVAGMTKYERRGVFVPVKVEGSGVLRLASIEAITFI